VSAVGAAVPETAGEPCVDAPSLPPSPARASIGAARPELTRGLVLGVGAVCLLSVAMYAAFHAIGVERIRLAVEAAGPWGPVVYVALKVATFVIAPLSSAPLRISAGAVFGFWDGVLLTVLGNVIGGSINFWLSRLVGRRVVARCIGATGMEGVDRLVGRLGDWRALVFARVFLAPAWDFVSYAAGFTPIRFGTYFVIAVVGDVIPSMLYVGIGTSLAEDPKLLLAVLAGFALLYALLPLARRLAPNVLTGPRSPRTEA
jgi:uncharacterized membrane protein YdjX (TVP38/TMEM64 family)